MATKRSSLNPKRKETEERYWSVWATHVENHSTLPETARTFGYASVSQVCRILKWCARQLQTDTPLEVTEGQVWNKLKRLRAIQPKREQVMGEDNHQAAIGYLREERELENDIAKLQGAVRELIQLTGPNGGPVQVETSTKDMSDEQVAALAANIGAALSGGGGPASSDAEGEN